MKYRKCYLSYFDLLGTKAMIKNGHFFEVMEYYNSAVQEFLRTQKEDYITKVSKEWFSDTFILYTRDSTPKSFAQIEHISRLFFIALLNNRIPSRGAITYGDFYSNQKQRIFFGPALNNAYEYGESQNWINFIMTPELENRIREIKLPPNERWNYMEYKIPWKKKCPEYIKSKNKLYAYSFHKLKYLETKLINMRTTSDTQKYDNTINTIWPTNALVDAKK